jgi:stage II sporulation protein D
MRRHLVTALTTMVLLAAAMPAGGQTPITFSFTGAGWGHGVGLSQYGARSLAVAGWTADQIVNHYYSGTTVRPIDHVVGPDHWMRADPAPMWIGLGQNLTNLQFTVNGPGPAGLCKANDGEGACPTQFAQTGESWEFRALGGGACQFFRGGVAVGNPGTCRASIEWGDQPSTSVTLGNFSRTYARGSIRIRPVGGGFHVVLELGIEDYIYGIGEVPSDWPAPALQAQALAARTYGVRQALRWGPEDQFSASRQQTCWCHLVSSVADQVYVGWSKESAPNGSNWVNAVNATATRLITHPQAPEATVIIAYYSSSSGGHTDSNVDGLGHTSVLPYLTGVPDPYSVDSNAQNPFASWTKDVSATDAAAALGLDSVSGMSIQSTNSSGSVAQVQVVGTLNGEPVTITRTGRSIRSALGLRSIFFNLGGPAGNPQAGPCDDPAAPAGFTDVAAGSVHAEDIDCLASLGITTGTTATTFDPVANVSRWQMALFLIRTAEVLGISLPGGADQGFLDLGGLSAEAVTAINRLRELNITQGTTETTFDPNGNVTRWQMALFLTRLHSATGFELPPGFDHGFADLNGLDESTVTAINQLAELAVTTGTSATTFSPANNVLREQMASFLARLVRIDT